MYWDWMENDTNLEKFIDTLGLVYLIDMYVLAAIL